MSDLSLDDHLDIYVYYVQLLKVWETILPFVGFHEFIEISLLNLVYISCC